MLAIARGYLNCWLQQQLLTQCLDDFRVTCEERILSRIDSAGTSRGRASGVWFQPQKRTTQVVTQSYSPFS